MTYYKLTADCPFSMTSRLKKTPTPTFFCSDSILEIGLLLRLSGKLLGYGARFSFCTSLSRLCVTVLQCADFTNLGWTRSVVGGGWGCERVLRIQFSLNPVVLDIPLRREKAPWREYTVLVVSGNSKWQSLFWLRLNITHFLLCVRSSSRSTSHLPW